MCDLGSHSVIRRDCVSHSYHIRRITKTLYFMSIPVFGCDRIEGVSLKYSHKSTNFRATYTVKSFSKKENIVQTTHTFIQQALLVSIQYL